MKLKQVVTDHISKLGVADAAKFYNVSLGTVSNWLNNKTNPSIEAVEMTMAAVGIEPTQTVAEEPPPIEMITMWEGRKVAILLPVYRTFNADTHFTLFANYIKYGPDKLAMLTPQKRTVIHEARSMLIHRAMKTDAETFIMVDDDMIIPFGEGGFFNQNFGGNLPPELAGRHGISRIMSHGRDHGIVGGLYFGRHAKGRAQCSLAFELPHENVKLREFEYKGLVKMGWVGTGFIKIERWVIEKMKAEIDGGLWPECKPIDESRHYGYFSPIRVGVGEDVSFGRRCEAIGIASYLDAGLVCLHNGECNYGPRNVGD